MRGDRVFIWLMLAPAVLILAAFYGYPMIENVRISFTDLTLLKLKQGGQWIGLANYRDFLQGPEFGHLLFNTFVWLTGLSVAIRLVLGIGIAVLLDSPVLKRLNLATVAKLAILVPWATPPIVAVIVWRWMLDPQNGIVNRVLVALHLVHDPIAFFSDLRTVWPAVITIIVWNTVPLVTLAILASLQSIPADLHDAAGLDGASRRQQFRYITLPLLKPTIVVLGLTSVFWTFNNFVYVWLATGAGPGTYTNVLATETFIRGFVDFRLGYGAAIGVIMALLMAMFGVVYFWLVGKRMEGSQA